MDNETLVRRHVQFIRRRNLRPNTIYTRGRVLHRLQLRHPGAHLLELSGDDIADGLDTWAVTPVSKASEISHLNQFYAWACHLTGTESPMAHVVRPRLPRRLPRPMPDEDVARALDGAPDRLYPMLMLAAYAGFRACEVAQARGEHANLDGDPPLMVVDVGKGGGMSTVPLHPQLVAMLRTMPRQGLLVPREDGEPGAIAAWRVSQLCNRYLHALGIGHTFHTLRHWYVTKLYQASDRDIRTTQEGARHESIVSTAGYTWVDPGAVAEAVTAIPAVGKRRPAAKPPAAKAA